MEEGGGFLELVNVIWVSYLFLIFAVFFRRLYRFFGFRLFMGFVILVYSGGVVVDIYGNG